MRVTAQTLAFCLVAFAPAAILSCAAQPARAGDGGADLPGLQAVIGKPNGSTGLCLFFGMNPCPQFPTITQAVLEIAGLTAQAPEVVRAFNAVPMGAAVDAANPSRPPAQRCVPACTDPLDPIAFPVDPAVLSGLTPLAFVSAGDDGNGPARATHLYNPEAETFLFAVAGSKNAGQPDTLVLFFDDPSRTDKTFQPGKVVAKISLPLTLLKNGIETSAPVILQYKAPSGRTLDCSASTVTGSLSGRATDFGINCAVVFAASPVSPEPHAIFEVAMPLLITAATDPAYFVFGFSFVFPPFVSPGVTGFSLGTNKGSIGIAPAAAPLGGPPPTGTPATYPLCASLPKGDDQNLTSAVAAFYAIAVTGETLLSAPLKPPPLANGKPSIVCPTGM